MTPHLRKLALTAHITSSVGFLGAVAAFLAHAVAVVVSQDTQMVRAAYLMMELTGWFVIVPLCLASLLTGLVQSLGTTWGLFRYYWVLAKLLINVFATIVLLIYMRSFSQLSGVMTEAASSSGDLSGLRNASPVVHAGAALVLLLVATTLSVYKTWALTRTARVSSTDSVRYLDELLPPDPQTISDYADAGERHRSCRDHWIEKAERGERNGGDIVEESPEQVLLDGSERQPRQPQGFDNLERAALNENDVAGLDSDVGPGPDSDAEIGLRESRRIIDAITDKGDALAFLLKTLNVLRLVLRENLGEGVLDVEFSRDSLRGLSVVSSDHDGNDAFGPQFRDGLLCAAFQSVGNRNETDGLAISRDDHDGFRPRLMGFDLRKALGEPNVLLAHKARVSDHHRGVFNAAFYALARDIGEILDAFRRQVFLLRGTHNGLPQRMLRQPFEAGRETEHRVRRNFRRKRHHLGDLRPALRQRACLVEHDNIDLAAALQRLSILDQNAAPRADARSQP